MGCLHVIHSDVAQMVDGKGESLHFDDALQVDIVPELQSLLHLEKPGFIFLINVVRDRYRPRWKGGKTDTLATCE